MKYQIVFSGKNNKKKKSKCLLLKTLPRMLSINDFNDHDYSSFITKCIKIQILFQAVRSPYFCKEKATETMSDLNQQASPFTVKTTALYWIKYQSVIEIVFLSRYALLVRAEPFITS